MGECPSRRSRRPRPRPSRPWHRGQHLPRPTPEPTLAGRWRGTGTQYATSGTTQHVSIRASVAADQSSGTLREHVVGDDHESFCRGTLTRVRAGRYVYQDLGSDCIARDRIHLALRSDGTVDFTERYRVPSGRIGRVVGQLRRE